VVTALGALHLAGRGPLAPPPLTAPSGWSAWLEGQDPVVAAFAVLRLAALGVGWYAVVVGVAGALARLASRRRLVAALDRLTVPPLRRLLAATVAVSLGAGLANPTVAAADRHDVPTVADSATSRTTPPTITMRHLPSSTEAEPGPTPATAPATDDRTWTVQPGQCFWSIAEAVLGESLGREVTPSEVVPYWNRLIEANRGALADPDNPDLIFPGQVFTVPRA
jgi:nucleoid-associated protein YgaU